MQRSVAPAYSPVPQDAVAETTARYSTADTHRSTRTDVCACQLLSGLPAELNWNDSPPAPATRQSIEFAGAVRLTDTWPDERSPLDICRRFDGTELSGDSLGRRGARAGRGAGRPDLAAAGGALARAGKGVRGARARRRGASARRAQWRSVLIARLRLLDPAAARALAGAGLDLAERAAGGPMALAAFAEVARLVDLHSSVARLPSCTRYGVAAPSVKAHATAPARGRATATSVRRMQEQHRVGGVEAHIVVVVVRKLRVPRLPASAQGNEHERQKPAKFSAAHTPCHGAAACSGNQSGE
jgi:hypothetical protein